MKPAKKWVYGKTREDDHYEDVLVPDDASYYKADMDAIVACAQCGKHLRFGETFTSKEIHTDGAAWGYGVCGNCYHAEWDRQFAADRRDGAA